MTRLETAPEVRRELKRTRIKDRFWRLLLSTLGTIPIRSPDDYADDLVRLLTGRGLVNVRAEHIGDGCYELSGDRLCHMCYKASGQSKRTSAP